MQKFVNKPRPELGDFIGDGRAVTIAQPPCDDHPPLAAWPTRNLISGSCPKCCGHLENGEAAARILRARRLSAATRGDTCRTPGTR